MTRTAKSHTLMRQAITSLLLVTIRELRTTYSAHQSDINLLKNEKTKQVESTKSVGEAPQFPAVISLALLSVGKIRHKAGVDTRPLLFS